MRTNSAESLRTHFVVYVDIFIIVYMDTLKRFQMVRDMPQDMLGDMFSGGFIDAFCRVYVATIRHVKTRLCKKNT